MASPQQSPGSSSSESTDATRSVEAADGAGATAPDGAPDRASATGAASAERSAAQADTEKAPIRRSRARGGMRSLVLSMLVILGLVLVWSALTPEHEQIRRPAIDAASSARTVSQQSGWPIRFAATPPSGWRPTSVSYGPTQQGPTVWRVGYHNADDSRYVDVLQTGGSKGKPLDDWLSTATSQGTADGQIAVGGTTWTRYRTQREPARPSLVARDSRSGMTYVITGPAAAEDLQAFAERLTPYRAS